DPAKENGPLSEGNWVVLQDARDQNPDENWWKNLTGKKDPVIWADKNKVELVPFTETDTQGRLEKFYVFGGEGDNSSLRGINLAGDIDDFVDKFQKSGKNLVLLVKHVDLNINNDVLYGGFILKIGDNDKENIWGGKISKENGTFIADLQKDLVTLGYWISDADLTNGMLCNGIIDIKTKGAITTFQRENNILETGILDLTTSNKIKECLSNPNWKRPANRTEKYGDFFQLPPSPYYKRYFPTYDTNGVIIDNWGTKNTINMILNCASKWSLKGMEYFLVGDISLYNGGEFRPHSSHRDGNSVDIDSSIYCSIDKPTFNKQTSLALAKLFVQYGAKRILFNCKYVIDNCNQVFSCIGHHNHFHIDCKDIQGTNQEKYECNKCALYSTCDYQNKR
ncbi:MAG TPA: peptidoglycan-binding domain-containing protein, partial [Chitinispirillaceae bacterium]|nr:peptidoglycan-binding domain-containing protein [Chitinispirillaceae bacterium]